MQIQTSIGGIEMKSGRRQVLDQSQRAGIGRHTLALVVENHRFHRFSVMRGFVGPPNGVIKRAPSLGAIMPTADPFTPAQQARVEYHRATLGVLFDPEALADAPACLRKVSEDVRTVIRAPKAQEYRYPAYLRKTAPREMLVKLEELLGALRAYRLRLVGMTEFDAGVVFSGDPEALSLQEAFATWMTDYAAVRWDRPSVRDARQPLRRFARLLNEFQPWVEELLDVGTGHSIVLMRLPSRLVWFLFGALAMEGDPQSLISEAMVADPKLYRKVVTLQSTFHAVFEDRTESLVDVTPRLSRPHLTRSECFEELALMASDLKAVERYPHFPGVSSPLPLLAT